MYHTIDPLILETLNLNERRMNHILDILHGRPSQPHPQTQRRRHNLTLPHTIKHINNQQQHLPAIATHRKQQKKTQEQELPKTYRRLNRKKSTQLIQNSRTRSPLGLADPPPEQSRQKQPKQNTKQIIRTGTQSRQNIPQLSYNEQLQRVQQDKRVQLLQDYMLRKLKRSKSQDINPKDIYRVQVETLISEPTPIQQLQESEKKIQRLKRRHRHLLTFDKQYYRKLNQHDLLALS